MRTVIIEQKIYSFSELSDKAKQRAKDDHARLFGYHDNEDALNSIHALAEHFHGKTSNYQIDWFKNSPSGMSFSMPDLTEDDIKEGLARLGSFNSETLKGDGECVLTGYCLDEDTIDGFRMAWFKGERDIDKLMQAAFKSWLEAAQRDCASFYCDENFAEHCDVNGYEFLEDGNIYSPKK